MSIFIKPTDRVAVTLPGEPENVIWVRRKMDVGTRNRVQDALVSIQNMDARGNASGVDLLIGRSNTVLLKENIVAWEGPKFSETEGGPIVPCTPAAIEMLDPDDPLVDAVLARINELNKKALITGEDGQPVSPLSSITASSANGKNGSRPSSAHGKAGAQRPG